MLKNLSFVSVLFWLLLAACQNQPNVLPTLIEFPQETVTPPATNTIEPSATVQVSTAIDTATIIPTNTPGAVIPVMTHQATFTAVPISTPTNTVNPSNTTTATATISPIVSVNATQVCETDAFVLRSNRRLDESYSSILQALVDDTGLATQSIGIFDDAFESRFCADDEEESPTYRLCHVLSIELVGDDYFTDLIRRATTVERIMTHLYRGNLCDVQYLELIFFNASATARVHWYAELEMIQTAYDADRYGIDLYSIGVECHAAFCNVP